MACYIRKIDKMENECIWEFCGIKKVNWGVLKRSGQLARIHCSQSVKQL